MMNSRTAAHRILLMLLEIETGHMARLEKHARRYSRGDLTITASHDGSFPMPRSHKPTIPHYTASFYRLGHMVRLVVWPDFSNEEL